MTPPNGHGSSRPYDVVIIGSGMGGSAVAYGLGRSGARVLVLERGSPIPAEAENWDPEAMVSGRYAARETWLDGDDVPFVPRSYACVGGNTKVYGAAMLRYRERDFEGVEHAEGVSVPWPIRYSDLSPWYDAAEEALGVHGNVGEDPAEPPRGPFPFAAVPHEPVIEELAGVWRAQGLAPFHLPVAIDRHEGRTDKGRCVRCRTCDGFPCKVDAKGDAETAFLRPAIAGGSVDLWTGALVERLTTSRDGKRVETAVVVHRGERFEVRAPTFVLAAGSIHSPALLLRSADHKHPGGLANAGGRVGRGYMAHNNTVLVALAPERLNPTHFQKTLAINDFYGAGAHGNYPLGNMQMRGKVLPAHLRRKPFIAPGDAEWVADRSVDLWLMSEDLSRPENRVFVDSQGRIHLSWRPNNEAPHRALVACARDLLHIAGFTTIYEERRTISTVSHQCGTTRFGDDPATAVLDPFCLTFEVPNLFVVDTGFYHFRWNILNQAGLGHDEAAAFTDIKMICCEF